MNDDVIEYEAETETETSTALMNPYSLDEIRSKIFTPSMRSLRMDGKLFKHPDGDASPGPIEAIVLQFVYINTFYKSRYNPRQIVAPECWAFSPEPEGHAPDPAVVPNPVAATCAVCPNNQWGSSPEGGKGKACQNRIYLAILNPNDAESGEILRVAVSPRGNGNWNKYVNSLMSRRLSYRQVLTKIYFDDAMTVPVLKFAMSDIHTVDPQIIAQRIHQVDEQRLLYRDPNNT